MIGFDPTREQWVDMAGGLLLAAFAIAVGVAGRMRGVSKWYVVFSIGYAGAAIFAVALSGFARGSDTDGVAWNWILAVIATLLLAAAAAWLVGTIRLLDAYGARAQRLGWGAAAVVVAIRMPAIAATLGASQSPAGLLMVLGVSIALREAAIAWMATAAIALAFANHRSPQPGQAILAAAMAAYPFATLAMLGTLGALRGTWDGLLLPVVILLYLAGAIAWSTLTAAQSRAHLAIAAVAGAFLFMGMMRVVWWPELRTGTIARAFDVLLVGYAILRLQYLGIDAKVRFGISKSTVAAIFVAVFFVASEAASQFFGDRFNNNYIGIAAAGLLVLGIAPLQRLADSVAGKAIPTGPAGVEAAYVAAVRAANRDGTITRREERHLADVADHLGIGGAKALHLREQVEQE